MNPLETAYNRLDETHRAWHLALDGYHKIDDFRAGVNTAIQALRNLTFALQKQKDNLNNFDEWYVVWQDKMRNDPILKELHEARNVIVKQEDLKLHSKAKARTKGWVDFERVSFTFDPLKDSHDVAKGFYDTYAKHLPVAEEIKKRLVFEFERQWIYEKLPNHELLDAISHSYHFFYEMLQDASQNFLVPIKNSYITGDYCESNFNTNKKLSCMIITPSERSITFSFERGEIIKLRSSKFKPSMEDMKKAHDRYGDTWKSEEVSSLFEGIFSDEYPFDDMKLFAQSAVSNLKKDKFLVPISFIFNSKGKPPIIMVHHFLNQEAKILAMDKLATEIIKNNGKFVLTMAEAWTYSFDEKDSKPPKIPTEDNHEGAKEILQITCMSAEEVKIITIPFQKDASDEIIFSKPEVETFLDDSHRQYSLMPTINALKQVNKI